MNNTIVVSVLLVLLFSLFISCSVLILRRALKKYDKNEIVCMEWVDFNQHIKSALDDYLINKGVDYSVLISGEWGVGKTRFIKKYIGDKENAIYVSCYGIKNRNDFSIQIVSQLYPFVFNKANAGLIRIISKVLGYGFNKDDIDFFAGSIFGRKEKAEYGILDGKILIIDDVERAEVSVSQIMSYVSRMLESFNCHCVLLAEEKKIHFLMEGMEKPDSPYRDIKEKTVAETFRLVPDGERAIESFIDQLCLSLSMGMRGCLKEAALSVYNDSGIKNLRVYRHAIMSLSRFVEFLGLNDFDSEAVTKDFLRMYVILKVESYSGILLDEKIEISDLDYKNQYSSDEGSIKKIVSERIFGVYGVRSDGAILDFDTWSDVIKKSIKNKESILIQIYRAIESRSSLGDPFWYWAWHFFRADKSDFEESLASILKKLQGDEVVNNRDIEQSISVLLSLSDEEIIDYKVDEIMELGREAIDRNIIKSGGIHFASDGFSRLTYNGFSYHEKERKEFLDFIDYVDLRIAEEMFERREGLGYEIYNKLQDDFPQTLLYISGDFGSNDMEWQSPFISGFDVKEFSAYFSYIEQSNRLAFCDAMEKRVHRLKAHGVDLTHETSWLNKVAFELKNRVGDNDALKRYHLNVICDKLSSISFAGKKS